MGSTSIKLYDKAGIIARVECTTNDPSFFKLHRWVKHRDGVRQWKLAPLRKNIFSLNDLRKLMKAANERYFAYMASIDDPSASLRDIHKMAAPVIENNRSFRGFDLFLEKDHSLFIAIARGEWLISGFRAADLRSHLPSLSTNQASYVIKRMRTHGLIKKVGRRYKYYLTKVGRHVLTAALKIRNALVIPSFSSAAT
jgi:hypothetical protein